MKNTFILLAASLTAITCSCQNNNSNKEQYVQEDSVAIPDAHTSQNALDWAGTYQDTIPCADCPGILTTIKLYEDGSFAYNAEYLEKNTSLQDSGKFMWHDNGSIIHLKGKNIDSKYKVGENVLFQTNTEGQIIEGDLADKFNLHKVF